MSLRLAALVRILARQIRVILYAKRGRCTEQTPFLPYRRFDALSFHQVSSRPARLALTFLPQFRIEFTAQGRPPRDEMRRQHHLCAWPVRILNSGDQAVDTLRGHAVDRLMHGSQRKRLTCRKRHVVVSHDGDVFGYLQTRAKHAVKDTDRG